MGNVIISRNAIEIGIGKYDRKESIRNNGSEVATIYRMSNLENNQQCNKSIEKRPQFKRTSFKQTCPFQNLQYSIDLHIV